MSEAALRSAARREREDAAPRLRDEVPTLETLHLELEERRGDSLLASGAHVRRVVVEHAPALFAIPCGERSCQDGGHDLTRWILSVLRKGETRFVGDDTCTGYSRDGGRCGIALHYVVVASYKPLQA